MRKNIASYLKIPITAILKFEQRGQEVHVILSDYRKMVIPAFEVNPISPIPPDEPRPTAVLPDKLNTERTATPLLFVPRDDDLLSILKEHSISTLGDLANKAHRLNRKTLRNIGKELDIPGATKMYKKPLVKAIKEHCK